MAAKKTAKKATEPVAKKAAKTAKKTAVKKAAKPVVTAPKTAAARPSLDAVARAAYLNYRRRVEEGLPGDMNGDWLYAEQQLTESTES